MGLASPPLAAGLAPAAPAPVRPALLRKRAAPPPSPSRRSLPRACKLARLGVAPLPHVLPCPSGGGASPILGLALAAPASGLGAPPVRLRPSLPRSCKRALSPPPLAPAPSSGVPPALGPLRGASASPAAPCGGCAGSSPLSLPLRRGPPRACKRLCVAPAASAALFVLLASAGVGLPGGGLPPSFPVAPGAPDPPAPPPRQSSGRLSARAAGSASPDALRSADLDVGPWRHPRTGVG